MTITAETVIEGILISEDPWKVTTDFATKVVEILRVEETKRKKER